MEEYAHDNTLKGHIDDKDWKAVSGLLGDCGAVRHVSCKMLNHLFKVCVDECLDVELFEKAVVVLINAKIHRKDYPGYQLPGRYLNSLLSKKAFDHARILLKHGTRVDGVNERGYSPIHTAILSDAPIDLICAIIEHKGCDINKHMEVGHYVGSTPLYVACFKFNLEAAKALVAAGANINPKGITCFNAVSETRGLYCYETKKKEELIVRFLCQNGADLNYKGESILSPIKHFTCRGKYNLALIVYNYGGLADRKDYWELSDDGRSEGWHMVPDRSREDAKNFLRALWAGRSRPKRDPELTVPRKKKYKFS